MESLEIIDNLAERITLRRGSYSGRYEIYDGEKHLGWVVRAGSLWHGFISVDVNYHTRGVASQMSNVHYARELVEDTRAHAVREILAYLVIRAGYGR